VGGGGIPLPGRHKKKKNQDDQQPLQSLTGMLRELNDKRVVVEGQDHRILNFKRETKTKFIKNGDELKPEALNPGDHLMIEYTQDDEGFMTAVNVNLDKEGTPAEREKASVPLDVIEPVGDSKAESDRPVLRRKDPPPDQAAASKPDASPAPQTGAQAGPAGSTPGGAPKPAQVSAPVAPPPIVPPEAGIDLDHIPASTSTHQSIDDSDSGPPRIARGKPPAQPKKNAETIEVAQNSPPPAANQPTLVRNSQGGSAPMMAQANEAPADRPTVLESAPPVDARIEKARDAVASFTETLPDYVVTEQMARFQSVTHVVSWQPLDIVSAELVYEKGKERYRNLAINGKLTKAQRMEDMPGSWSTGEFASVLLDIFSPATATDFRYRHMSRSGGREAYLYDFDVDREHSHWQIAMPSQSVLPAYRGSLWIDKETARVLRVEMQAVRLPVEFPLDKVEMASDYEFTRIADRQFLLPVHSENLMCQRGTNQCSHNVIDFRNYHKYAGEATIEFGK
jgi:hypothetical protein